MNELLNELAFSTALPWQVVCLRLLGAVIFCGVIGVERETQRRPAGLRTHMLVGLAAALYTLLMLEMLHNTQVEGTEIRMDPLRIIEAVTGGVAFLAAGMIVFSQGKVKGLTTGTSLWLAAAVGVSAGLGVWMMAVLTTLLALIIIRFVKIAEKKAGTGDRDVPGAEDEA